MGSSEIAEIFCDNFRPATIAGLSVIISLWIPGRVIPAIFFWIQDVGGHEIGCHSKESQVPPFGLKAVNFV